MSETVKINLPLDAIREHCASQPIKRLSVFRSAVRAELRPESDIDLLVDYEPDAPVGSLAMSGHRLDLSEIVGRDVDLCSPNGLSKFIRDDVLDYARLIFANES